MSYELTSKNIAIEFGNSSPYGSRQDSLQLQIDKLVLQTRIDTLNEVIAFVKPLYDGFRSKKEYRNGAFGFGAVIESIQATVELEEEVMRGLGTDKESEKLLGIDPAVTESLVKRAIDVAWDSEDEKLSQITGMLIVALNNAMDKKAG